MKILRTCHSGYDSIDVYFMTPDESIWCIEFYYLEIPKEKRLLRLTETTTLIYVHSPLSETRQYWIDLKRVI